ncbi:hypothetical protein HRbin36_02792 [bacterium HR36]|nr:hypothetical protein HRbin36_02792 [bacterium HR36]
MFSISRDENAYASRIAGVAFAFAKAAKPFPFITNQVSERVMGSSIPNLPHFEKLRLRWFRLRPRRGHQYSAKEPDHRVLLS